MAGAVPSEPRLSAASCGRGRPATYRGHLAPSAWRRPYAQIYAGASMHAAELLATGKADIAINWSGGQAPAAATAAAAATMTLPKHSPSCW